jgi:hypothetical protein
MTFRYTDFLKQNIADGRLSQTEHDPSKPFEAEQALTAPVHILNSSVPFG